MLKLTEVHKLFEHYKVYESKSKNRLNNAVGAGNQTVLFGARLLRSA